MYRSINSPPDERNANDDGGHERLGVEVHLPGFALRTHPLEKVASLVRSFGLLDPFVLELASPG